MFDIAIVSLGTIAAQLISLSFVPIITRLYSPEAFGLFGVYMSVAGFISTVSSLGYPAAIVLPIHDSDAIGLIHLSVFCVFLNSILMICILFFCGQSVFILLNSETIAPYTYLLPITAIASVLGGVLNQWLVRMKSYYQTAGYSIVSALSAALSKSLAGLVRPSVFALIASNLLGVVAGSVYVLFFRVGSEKKLVSTRKETRRPSKPWRFYFDLAKQYSDFPLYRVPQNLINLCSQHLPVLILAGYSGTSSAGQYILVKSALGLPATFIGNSAMSVFYPRVTEAIHNNKDVFSMLMRATVGMAIVGIWPFLAVTVAGPFLFKSLFGGQWYVAGQYAQWLSIFFFFQFLNKPVVAAIPSLNLQKGLLYYEIFSTVSKIFALSGCLYFLQSDLLALAMFSVFGVISYCWLIGWVIVHSRHYGNRGG